MRGIAIISKLLFISIVNLTVLTPISAQKEVMQWSVFEASFTATRSYTNPFTDTEVNVIFKTNGDQWVVPAFWAGGSKWTVRFAPPAAGVYQYHVESTQKKDAGLNGHEGTIKVIPGSNDNPFLRHGFIRISDNRRYFEYADGTPFFWLGDTWWKGLSGRISLQDFKDLTKDRHEKGFSVVQIIAGPYPDEPPFDQRWANEGGLPYFDREYTRINPLYFDYADKRIECLIQSGIMPAIVGGWSWHMPSTGVKKMERHWRYLIARYGAYPGCWIVGGEAGGQEWTDVANYVQQTDPYQHPATIHPYPGSGRHAVTDESVVTFDMVQCGHGGVFGEKSPYGVWQATAANTVSLVMASYSKQPAMPVVVGEVTYEGHMMANGPEVQRQVYWSAFLSGAAGHTYGAGGIWQMNSDSVRGAEYEFTPWFEAMKLPGSTQLGYAKSLLEQYEWWKFTPHPEWVEPHASPLFENHTDWYDSNEQFISTGGRWDQPYAAGIPGEVRIIFIPGHYYDWSSPVIRNLEQDVAYNSFLFNPATAKRYDLGIVINTNNENPPIDASKYSTYRNHNKIRPLIINENPNIAPSVTIPKVTRVTDGQYRLPRLPAPQDWVLVMEKVKP